MHLINKLLTKLYQASDKALKDSETLGSQEFVNLILITLGIKN